MFEWQNENTAVDYSEAAIASARAMTNESNGHWNSSEGMGGRISTEDHCNKQQTFGDIKLSHAAR